MNQYKIEITIQICNTTLPTEQRTVSMPIIVALEQTIDQLCGQIAIAIYQQWQDYQDHQPATKPTTKSIKKAQEILH